MEISLEDDERTLTMVEDLCGEDVAGNASSLSPAPLADNRDAAAADTSSKSVKDNKEKILTELEDAMAKITVVHADLGEFFAIQQKSRFLVSREKLLELAGDKCKFTVDDHVCGGELHFHTQEVGTVLEITCSCDNNHFRKWTSSEVLDYKNNNRVFVNDSMLAASVIVSGNNYAKFKLLCQALGLSLISESTFLRFQKHCAAPVVEEVWRDMNNVVKQVFKAYEDICLCGDGRNDSPGHSARYCVYTLMEHFTNAIIDFEVIDKRETGGNSTTTEKEALRRLLENLVTVFPFDELTTDASPTVIKLVRDLKGELRTCRFLHHRQTVVTVFVMSLLCQYNSFHIYQGLSLLRARKNGNKVAFNERLENTLRIWIITLLIKLNTVQFTCI